MEGCFSTDDRENDAPPVEQAVAATQKNCGVLVELGDCRMCFQGQTSNHDPVVPLGCKCFRENSRAHISCIQKWFPNQFMRRGILECEVCEWALGSQPRSTVMKVVRPRMFRLMLRRGFRQVLQRIEHFENEFIRVFFPPLHPSFNYPESILHIPPEEGFLFQMDP